MMMMKNNFLPLLLGTGSLATMAFLTATPAHAFTLSVDTVNAFSQVAGVTEVFFEGASRLTPTPYTENGVEYSGGGVIANVPNVGSRFAAPPAKGSYATGTNYLSLGASQEPGPVTIKLPSLSKYFGLYWGSVDSYNSIQFLRDGNPILNALFTGYDALDPANGNQGAVGSVYANFFADNSNEWFNEIKLFSDRGAFESDNHAYQAVPTPALLPGLIGLGVAALRRKKDETAEETA